MAFTGGCAEETKYNKIGGFLFLNLRKWNQVEFRSVWENLFLNYSEITSCCPFPKVSISSRMTVLCLCRLASKIKNQRKCRLFKIKVLSITLRGSHYGFLHSAARLLAVGQTSADWRRFGGELWCSERHCSNSPVPTTHYITDHPSLHREYCLPLASSSEIKTDTTTTTATTTRFASFYKRAMLLGSRNLDDLLVWQNFSWSDQHIFLSGVAACCCFVLSLSQQLWVKT